MIEYVLQKKLLGGWSYVTWWSENELDKAQRSYDAQTKGDTGYSWRLVKLDTLQEKLLNDVKEVEAPGLEDKGTSGGWTKPNQQTNGGWGSQKETQTAQYIVPKSEHGLTGSVWIGNPTTKEKKRVPAVEAAKMLENGWIKAGPRSTL